MKRLIITILISALLMNLYGCYSMQEITVQELETLEECPKIILDVKDNLEFVFNEESYIISRDSISGSGFIKIKNPVTFEGDSSEWRMLRKYKSVEKLEGNVAKSNIESIQTEKFNLVLTAVVIIVPLSILILIGASELSVVPDKGWKF